jgi:hypothetical protein
MRPETTNINTPSHRAAAVALVACTVLSAIAVAAHPSINASSASQILADMVKGRGADEHVHAAVIIFMAGYFFGFVGFAQRVGLQRTSVRLGLIAYGLGVLGMVVAAMFDGFITPGYAAQFAGAPPDKADMAIAVLRLGWTQIQYFSVLGFIGMSLGMLGVSLPLLQAGGLARITGIAGLISGVLPVAFLIIARVDLDPPLLIGILAIQSIWNLTAAAWLIHGSEAVAPAGLSQPA